MPTAAVPAIPDIDRTIALVGLMGVGKSTVGRRLARRLERPFFDADAEIEAAAAMSVSDIFATLGEPEFRAGETRVIRRLLEGERKVVATGGGAMINPDTRAVLKAHALTVWLKADLDVVVQRVARRDTRPLLRGRDPKATLSALAEARYPIYAEADMTVEVGAGTHSQAVEAVVAALARWAKEKGGAGA
jgi:shikimate kinase